MICQPGKCLKCGVAISINGMANSLYNEIIVSLSNGSTMSIGVCPECNFEESEYVEVMDCINQAFEASGGVPIEAEISSVLCRKNIAEIILGIQGGRCPKCHETIGENYIFTNGKVQHESCDAYKDRVSLLAENESLRQQINELNGG